MFNQTVPFPPSDLASLGRRIVVLGPSNAGKSTLALALSVKLGVNVVHLDQFRFQPNTDWALRSDAEFKALHDDAIEGDSWVMDGNYSMLLPPRLTRATGVVLVTSNSAFRFFRYVKRTVSNQEHRVGALEGGKDSLKWDMVSWILIKTRNSAAKYAKVIRSTGKPVVECHTMKQLDLLYQAWGLQMPK